LTIDYRIDHREHNFHAALIQTFNPVQGLEDFFISADRRFILLGTPKNISKT
jgi:hypothetical protein